jgi:hypothetical protein
VENLFSDLPWWIIPAALMVVVFCLIAIAISLRTIKSHRKRLHQRKTFFASCECSWDGHLINAKTIDISPAGACIAYKGDLPPVGTRISMTLTLDNVYNLAGEVKYWKTDVPEPYFGVELLKQGDYEILELYLVQHESGF